MCSSGTKGRASLVIVFRGRGGGDRGRVVDKCNNLATSLINYVLIAGTEKKMIY